MLQESKELYLHRDGLRSAFFCLKLCCLLFGGMSNVKTAYDKNSQSGVYYF